MECANLYIAYASQVAEGSRTETLLGGNYAEVAYTPDQRLVNTLNLGKTSPTENETTAEQATSPVTENNESNGDGAGTSADPGKDQGCGSVMIAPIALLLTAAGYVLCRKRKE